MGKSPAADVAEWIVAEEAHGAISSEQWAEVAVRSKERLARTLSPVLGDAGFHALFVRSVKKARPQLACLQELVTTTAPPEVWRAQLSTKLSQQEPALVREAVAALLACFFQLLSTLIGEGLTWRLFQNVWPRLMTGEVAPVKKS